MIYFSEIFDRAFNLFADPDIEKKYFNDRAGFQKDMLDFLIIGKNKFVSPVAVTNQLINMEKSEGKYEEDFGDGGDEYTLESEIPHNGTGVGFTFFINKEKVRGVYNPDNNSVKFERKVSPEEVWGVCWFYAGAFTSDFSSCFRKGDYSSEAIMEKIINILAYGLLSAWGDKEVGRVLEVRNILTDHDFEMYSPANSARAKVEWRNQMNRDMDTLISELNWMILSTPRGGSRFGK